MAIDFAGVQATISTTEAEVVEYDQAVTALGGAKDTMIAAQEATNVAQLAVTAATESVSTEKADVVAGIAAAIAQLNSLLAELQE